MAAPTLTYTITNGTANDATQVMQNFNDLLNGYTDGSKDLNISALTCAGTTTFNGNVALGNSTTDEISFTGRMVSTIIPMAGNTYQLGNYGSGLGWSGLALGANGQRVFVQAAGSGEWTFTLPTGAGTSGYGMVTDGSGNSSWALIPRFATAGTWTATQDFTANGITVPKDKGANPSSIGEVYSGTWTTTPTNVNNFTGTLAMSGIYIRVGDVVHCSVNMTGQVRSSGSGTESYVKFSPPITPSFSAATEGLGTVIMQKGTSTSTDGGYFLAGTGGDAALMYLLVQSTNSTTQSVNIYGTFTYDI